jgi:hypothetical protein
MTFANGSVAMTAGTIAMMLASVLSKRCRQAGEVGRHPG